jgi:diguanylate cyclase (GGDEF)-like protein
MTGVSLALTAALVLLAICVLVALAWGRRAVRRSEERVTHAIGDVHARMELMGRDLTAALRAAERESRLNRTLAELAGSLELDDVLAQLLESAVAAVGADAALARLPDVADGKPLVVTLGLSAEEAQREGVVAGPPDGRRARAVTMTYRYSDEVSGADDLVRGGLAVPLSAGDAVGTLAVFARSPGASFGNGAIDALEELASRSGPALQNARRFQEARRAADVDALTGLHNRRHFHEILARETGRAHRYGRRLALVVLDVDDFKAVNDRVGHLAGDAVLAEVGQRIAGVVRSADVACRVGGDEFAVVLPESSAEEAGLLFQRLQDALATHPVIDHTTLRLSAGVAALDAQDDARSLFQRADDALYRAKHQGKAKMVVAGV